MSNQKPKNLNDLFEMMKMDEIIVSDIAIEIQTKAMNKWIRNNLIDGSEHTYYYNYFGKTGYFNGGVTIADIVVKGGINKNDATDYLVKNLWTIMHNTLNQ